MSTTDPPDKGFRAFVTEFSDYGLNVRIVTVAQSRDDVARFLINEGLVTTDLAETKNNTWDLPFGFCSQPATVVCIEMIRGKYDQRQKTRGRH